MSRDVLLEQIRSLKSDWLEKSGLHGASILSASQRADTPNKFLASTNMAFEAIDGMQDILENHGPPIDPDIVTLLFGSSRRHEGAPLEPYCSFCTLAHMVLRKIGAPLHVV